MVLESVQVRTGGRGGSKFRVFIAYVLNGWPLKELAEKRLKNDIFEFVKIFLNRYVESQLE